MKTIDACKACGASGDLERDVVEHDARACMACGHVRVITSEVVYSDNPHVDPEVVETEATIDPIALAWVSAFPRRTRSGSAFMPATTRAKTLEELKTIERAAEESSPRSVRDSIVAGGVPGAPPQGHLSSAVAPFIRLSEALAFTDASPMLGVASLISYGAREIAIEIAREHLASRAHAFREVAAAIDTFRPDMLKAIVPARDAATPDEIAALEAAISQKMARADPHSSDIGDLRRVLAALRA